MFWRDRTEGKLHYGNELWSKGYCHVGGVLAESATMAGMKRTDSRQNAPANDAIGTVNLSRSALSGSHFADIFRVIDTHRACELKLELVFVSHF